MGFTEAGPSHENDVGLVLVKGEAKEILHMRAIDLFGPGPVELLDGFNHGGSAPPGCGVGLWEGTDAKDAAISDWCARISKQTSQTWKFTRINQGPFDAFKPKTLAEAIAGPRDEQTELTTSKP